MGRIGISEYQVFQAAEQLAAEGVNPTVDAVRMELGNTGSRTTINKYLKAWRERRAHREHAGANLSGHLLQVLREQSEIILAVIEAENSAKFQTQSEQYESTIGAQELRISTLSNDLNAYQTQLQELKKLCDQQQHQRQQLTVELNTSRDDNHLSREALAREVGRRETLEQAAVERDRQLIAAQKELKTLQSRNDILTESHTANLAELRQLRERDRQTTGVIKEKTAEIKQLNQALKAAQLLREKDIGRLTLSVNQLVQSRTVDKRTRSKAIPKTQ